MWCISVFKTIIDVCAIVNAFTNHLSQTLVCLVLLLKQKVRAHGGLVLFSLLFFPQITVDFSLPKSIPTMLSHPCNIFRT